MPSKPYKYCRPPRRPTEHHVEYEKLMNEQDKEMLRIMNGNLDNLLIFAALFSGVNGAFIAITLNLLIPSSADTTNALLHFLIQRIDNSTTIPSEIYPPPSFPGTTRINCYFCASLAFSLVVALGAIIGKQWLLYYDRVGDVDPLQSTRSWRPLGVEHRGRQRLHKLRGLQRWHLQAILEAGLPTMLQLAVLIFFVGLIDFTRSVEPPIGWLTLGIAAAGFGVYAITVTAAIWDPDCPFQTPVTKTVLPFLYLPILHAFRSARSACFGAFDSARRAVSRLSRSRVVLWAQKKLDEEYEHSELDGRLLSSGRADPDIRDQPGIEEMYAPSTDDIEVASWILSTSMDPKALRAAAASLPYLHVPSVLTTKHLEPTAISRLLFLFQDACNAYIRSKSPESQSDLLVYGRALSHVLLSSLVEETVQARSLSPRPLPWWTSYLDSMKSIAYDVQDTLPELWNNYALMKDWLLEDYLESEDWTPIWDPEETPFHVSAIVYLRFSRVKLLPEYKLINFLVGIGRNVGARAGATEKGNTLVPQWNTVNVAALALSLPDYANLELGTQVDHILAIWEAYTDFRSISYNDTNIFSNFANACGVYKERVEKTWMTWERREVDKVYEWLFCSMRAIVQDMAKVGNSWDRVALGCIEFAVVGLHRYSNNEADKSILTMVRDSLRIAAKVPDQIPSGAVTPLWRFGLDKNSPSNALEVVLEGITYIPWLRWHDDTVVPGDRTDVISDAQCTARLLDLLKSPDETLHVVALRLLRECVHTREAANMFLRDDIISLIAGQRDASTCDEGVFGVIAGLLGKVIVLLRGSRQGTQTLARAAVERATLDTSVVAVAMICWERVYRYTEGLFERGEQPVSDSEDARGTGRDPIWFSNAMVNAISEYLVATPRPRESLHVLPPLNIAFAIMQYHDRLDISIKQGTLDLDSATLARFTGAYERWKDGGGKDDGMRGSDLDDKVSKPSVMYASTQALEFALDY